jgi:very-short-patch-repair endonuclease
LEQEAYDQERTKYLESQGYKVIRFWNNQVMNDMDGVIRAIIFAMEPGTHS